MSQEPKRDSWLKRHRRVLLIGGPLIILVVAGIVYVTGGRYVSTDDAYIQTARTDISTTIAGRVTEMDVHDNQPVKKGDVLFRLDNRPYLIAVDDAQAKLADARMQIAAVKATYLQREADVQAATDTLAYAEKEQARQKKLAAQGISSQAQLDQANHTVAAAQQQLNAAQQEQQNVRASLGDDPDIEVNDHPLVKQAQAALDHARLNLSYTVITAPSDGVVTKVEQLQVGKYINASTPVFALMSTSDIWIEGNFKETDLTYMRPGQEADIEIDTYPGRTFKGKVESTSPGTGSSFSLLPPENASGNWVKVVQRLPVRVSFDDVHQDVPLNAGFSVTVNVDTGKNRLERKH